jgi:hypothetical protein
MREDRRKDSAFAKFDSDIRIKLQRRSKISARIRCNQRTPLSSTASITNAAVIATTSTTSSFTNESLHQTEITQTSHSVDRGKPGHKSLS